MKTRVTGTIQIMTLIAVLLATLILSCNSTQSPTSSPEGSTNVTMNAPEEPIPTLTATAPATDPEIEEDTAKWTATPEEGSQEARPPAALQSISPARGSVPLNVAPPVAASNVPTTRALSMPGEESEAVSLEDTLTLGLYGAGISPVHIAFQGTPVNDSVRCDWRGIARTSAQRDQAIRYWLKLNDQEDLPDPDYLKVLFTTALDTLEVNYLETTKSNLMAVAKGGLSTEYQFLTCFADYTVSNYLLGAGPATITVATDKADESASYELYVRERAAGQYGDDPLRTQSGHSALMQNKKAQAEAALSAQVGTQEVIVFLAPMGSHNAIAFETWLSVGQWDVMTNDEGTVMAVRRGAGTGDSEYTQTLANLQTRVTAATTNDAFADDRIANISGLNQHYREIGAYDDITPGDGSDATFMPAMPPPVPTCAGSTAVGTDPEQGLVDDCNTLLDTKDALAGTATLNWSKDTAMSDWTGITLSGDRVHRIILTDQSLAGSIPAELGQLSELTRIDLDENSLTGEIPAQLGNLKQMTHLYLFENELSGEIPPELGHMTALQVLYVEDNDLTGAIPAEIGDLSNLTQLILGDNELSGDIPDGIGDIPGLAHLVLRDNGFTGQIPRSLSARTFANLGLSGNSFTGCLPTGLDSSDAHDLWRAELTALPSCGPSFSQETYTFSVARTSAAGDAVGTTTATPWDTGGTVAHAITAGNEISLFQIDPATGEITLARAPAGTDTDAHTLAVQGTDGHGQEATATVTITLTP